jgi:hypothetical protein
MKQVVLPTSRTATIDPEATSNSKFYGVQIWSSGIKKQPVGRGFITRDTYNGFLQIRVSKSFTAGNGLYNTPCPQTTKLPFFIKELLGSRDFDVFEFHTIMELMEWVTKGDMQGW